MNTKHYVNSDVMQFQDLGMLPEVTQVALYVDDDTCFISPVGGDESGYTIEAFCPSATQHMADNILAQLKGYRYQGYTATSASIALSAELGDGVMLRGIYGMLAMQETSFGVTGTSDISAPSEDQLNKKYPFQSETKREITRKLAQTRSLINKTAEELRLMVEGFDGRISELSVNVDSITGEVRGLAEDYAAFRLTVEGFWVDGPNGSTLIAGSMIDTSTLNVDNINIDLSGRISFEDLTNYQTVQGDIDAAYDLAAEAYDLADSVSLPSYIKRTYIDAVTIKSPTIEANDIGLYGGYFVIKDSTGEETYGSMGYGSGKTTAGETTLGVVMSAAGNTNLGEEGNYFIATDAGVRMQSGASKVYAVDGMAVLESHGNQIYVGPAGAYIKVNGVISAIGAGGGGTGATDPSGYMLASGYDPNGTVAAAGGIVAYVSSIVGKIDILLAHINDGGYDSILDEINGEVV